MAEATLAFNILTKYRDTGAKAAARDMDKLDQSSKSSSSTLSKFGGIAMGVGAALGTIGFAAAIKGSIGLEAKFGQTMATIKAATGASSAEMKKFNDLAIKLGADTSFSAGEAADAMLELAKAGLSTKTIMGGGVRGTLLLAAAGGTDLATAATIASNAINTFNLKGKDMKSVASALAGGANASSASVESLGQALQQVGPGAKNAGLSLQETVAALSAFDAAGIKGSDAGTSLKTFLARLVPQTEKASTAFEQLGLWSEKTGNKLVDQQGNFKSLTAITELLHKGMSGLSDAQRTSALNSAFGSDASRAAIVLANLGTAGLAKYTKATNDQSAAQEMANARMSGTAGALERLKGSVETVALRFGQEMAPGVQMVANALANNLVPASEKTISVITSVAGFVDRNRTSSLALLGTITALVAITKVHTTVMAVQAAGGLLPMFKATNLVASATKTYAAVQWLLNAALTANPIGLVIVGLVALGTGLVLAYKKSETFRDIVNGALQAVQRVATTVFNAVTGAATKAFGWLHDNWPLLLAILTGPFGVAALVIVRNWDKITGGVHDAFEGIKEIVRTGTLSVVDKMLWMAEHVLDTAVSAFGWAPGIGDKLKDARDKVHQFRDGVNAELQGIRDENVEVTVNAGFSTSGHGRADTPAFAEGGAVSGGVPGRDSVAAWLMPGEHVLTADEVRKAGGHGAIKAIRRMLKRGEFAKRGDVPAFAQGGPVFGASTSKGDIAGPIQAIVGDTIASLTRAAIAKAKEILDRLGGEGKLTPAQIARGQAFARSQVGDPYVWGGVGPNGFDCSGFVGAVLNAAEGKKPNSRRGTTGSMPWGGFTPGKGSFSVGWFTGDPGHMAGSIGGMGIESAGGVGVRVGAAARSLGTFPNVAHYDQGGWLQPGWTAAFNGTGTPERITAPHQERSRDSLGVVEVVVRTEDGREIQRKLLEVKRKTGQNLGLA